MRILAPHSTLACPRHHRSNSHQEVHCIPRWQTASRHGCLICISTAFGLRMSHPLLSVHVDLKQRLAACVQLEHTPTDTAPVSVHFRFLFGTPLHHPVEASVSRRVVHHAFAARLGQQSRTQSLSVPIAAIEATAHCARHCCPSLLFVTRFVLNAPMALHGRSTVSCTTTF